MRGCLGVLTGTEVQSPPSSYDYVVRPTHPEPEVRSTDQRLCLLRLVSGLGGQDFPGESWSVSDAQRAGCL